MENKIKHLEFIQGVITRMAANSFMIKGWVITLIAAVFAVSAAEKDLYVGFLNYLILPAFWILDGFFLSQERQYRGLYNEVTQKTEEEVNFSLNAKNYAKGKNGWFYSTFSNTLLLFYGMLMLLSFLTTYHIIYVK